MGHGGEVLLAFQGFLALAESSLESEKDWSKIVRVQICSCAFFSPQLSLIAALLELGL